MFGTVLVFLERLMNMVAECNCFVYLKYAIAGNYMIDWEM